MSIIGILFILYDTISDRSKRRNVMLNKIHKKGPRKAEDEKSGKIKGEKVKIKKKVKG